AGHLQLTVHTRMLRRETAKSGLRNSVDAQNKASVFDGATGIDQSRADCTSLGALYVLSHDREPVRADRFYLIVKEKKPRTIGVRDGMIFRCGFIHGVCEIQQTMRKICGRRSDFVTLAHFNDHDLVTRIACRANHAFDTSLERLRAAVTRNDNGDLFGFAQLASHIKRVGSPVDSNMGLLTSALQVSFDCAPRGFELSWLLTNIAGAGILAAPPVVEHARDMMNLVSSLGNTQEKIVIL